MLCCLLLMPIMGAQAQSTVQDGQSTEGKDFWVTFMQADQTQSKSDGKPSGDLEEDNYYNTLILSLSISAREDCQVTISNPFTSYTETVDVTANEMKLVELYSGHPVTNKARSKMEETGKVCYAVNSETVDTCALHITATKNIALFATNYKKATFDATNVIPTTSLLKEYYIQTYTPSDHGGTAQGSHFAVIATEDNTKVWYTPSVLTPKYAEYRTYLNNKNDPFADPETLKADSIKWAGFVIGEHTDSVVLQKGHVYYVWTGEGEKDDYDLSGTHVKANKNIAVFQGCPHTNIPYKVRERDHIFSQAMPTQYWGNTFVLTGSGSRHRDFVRIMALNDETDIYINGEKKHTIKFDTDKKRYWEFEFGDKDVKGGNTNKADKLEPRPYPQVEGDNCIITTSCPCAVHMFEASRQWDGDKDNYGDPSMLWVNPIEQQIDQVTFATYASRQKKDGKLLATDHYVNIVTDQPDLMTLDGNNFASGDFKKVTGSDVYYYAKKSLGNEARSHTLKSNGGNFIAHVYGFTANESYGYSAGGATKPLTQYITINGQIFTPDSKNILCGDDTIRFACHPDYEYEKIEWYFGDGTSNLENKDSVPHEYETAGVYNAYVLIYRNSTNVCVGQNAVDSIPITVNIGNFKVNIKEEKMPECSLEGDEVDFLVYLDNPAGVSLTSDSVQFTFSKAAKEAGFSMDKVKVQGDTLLIITLPSGAKNRTQYDLHLHIGSECPNSVLDKDLAITPTFDIPVLAQRYNNVLGVLKDSFPTQELTNFVWFHDGDTVPNQETSVLYLDEKDPKNNGEYKVCFTIKEEGKADINYCTCPIQFTANSKQHEFEANPDSLIVTATYIAAKGGKVFVNIDYNGETNINCYAEWYDVSGRAVVGGKYENLPDGGCTIDAPATEGLYLLRVVTGKGTRSFKFIVNN